MTFDYRDEYQRYRKYYTNLKRFYQKPVARVSVFVVISFMTVSFFSIFAIKPTLVTISQLVKEIEDKKEINQKLEKKLIDLTRAQTEYVQVRDDVALVWRAIPDEPELAKLILQLELLALKKGVSMVNLQVEPVVLMGKREMDKGGLSKYEISVTAGGSFDQARAYGEAVKQLERVVVVKEMTFTVGTPFLQREGVGVTVAIRGEVYFKTEKGKVDRAN